jgi:hypothetical protein
MSITEQLRSRYRPDYERHATAKATKVHLWTATALIDQIAAKRAEIDQDKNLSETGKAGKVSDYAQSLAPTLAKARGAVAGAKIAIARKREALTPKVKDRNDISAAMLRAEMRGYLRNMRPAEAIAFANSDAADETFFTAIFETPIALSNLSGIGRERLLQAYLDRFASTQLADIAEQSEAIELLETAVSAASGHFAKAAGVKLDKLDDFLAERAPNVAAKVEEEFAPASQKPVVIAPKSDSDAITARLLAEGIAEFAAINASGGN